MDYYDIHLEPDTEYNINTAPERSVILFTLLGEAMIGGTAVREKTAVKLTAGDRVTIRSGAKPAQVLFISSLSLKEPVAWSGPIVMNTDAELRQAFADLHNGTFLKDSISYDEN